MHSHQIIQKLMPLMDETAPKDILDGILIVQQQQMKLAGSEVPLVRCLLHEPALNLSIGGKVYSSAVYWELNFTNATTKLEDFSPHE